MIEVELPVVQGDMLGLPHICLKCPADCGAAWASIPAEISTPTTDFAISANSLIADWPVPQPTSRAYPHPSPKEQADRIFSITSECNMAGRGRIARRRSGSRRNSFTQSFAEA